MIETIWQTAVNTPWWVYFLLCFLVKMGVQASKTRVVSLKRLLIIPLLFMMAEKNILAKTVRLLVATYHGDNDE